jgi:hypothetical protein
MPDFIVCEKSVLFKMPEKIVGFAMIGIDSAGSSLKMARPVKGLRLNW